MVYTELFVCDPDVSGAPVYTKLLIFALSGPINCMADILQASPHLKYGAFFTTLIQLCDCARL